LILLSRESAAISGLQGQTSVQHVVESVMGAERSLQTVVAIRDKIVSRINRSVKWLYEDKMQALAIAATGWPRKT